MKRLKKMMAVFLAFAVLCGLGTGLPQNILPVHHVYAVETSSEDDFSYRLINEGNQVEITKYNGSNATVEIPDNIDGKMVSSIGNSAFKNSAFLINIVIPENVTSIGNNAFDGCTGITKVTVNGGKLENIGNYAFRGTKITGISLPDSVSYIGAAAFMNCTALTSIVIPEKVTALNSNYYDGTFKGCTSLISVTLPSNLTNITDYAFEGCTKLETVSLPEGITALGKDVFKGCTSLSAITLPKNITKIPDGAFYKCTALKSIVVPENVTSIGNNAFDGCTDITKVTVNGKKLESIGNYAFRGTKITGISLPDSVSYIGAAAFMNCTALTSIVIPEKVTALNGYYNDGTFEGCTSLVSVTLSPNITAVSDDTFRGCVKLGNIVLPESITAFGAGVFGECTSLSSITLPKNIASISGGMFQGCTALKSIAVPENVTSIGNGAFEGCTGITEVTINSEKLESIGTYAFKGTKITGISLPESVSYIGGAAFMNCTALTTIVIPEKVTALNSYMTVFYFTYGTFEGCTSLVSVTLPSNIISISDCTFKGCASLKSIVIPESVESVGKSAFGNCKSLVRVIFKNDFTQVAANAFEGCTGLSEFPRPSVTINSLKIKNSDPDGISPYTSDRIGNYNISVKNSAGKNVFTGVSGSCVIIDVNRVSANETLTITFEHKNGKTLPETITVKLDGDRRTSVDEVILKEKGYLKINYPSEQNIKAVIYDTDGNYVDSYAGKNGTIRSKHISGEFNVYVLNTSLDNYGFSSPEEYPSRGFIANRDYFIRTVTVEDNPVSINLTSVPENTDTKLRCLSVYDVESDVSKLSEDGYLTCKITYKMKDECAAEAEKLIVSLSDNLSFISGSLFINDNFMGISAADRFNKIEVPVKDIREGVITLKAMPVSNGRYTVSAAVLFTENGKTFSERLEEQSCTADFITLNGERNTNSHSIFVTGVTSSADPVEIYVNGDPALEIMPDSDGKYSEELVLSESYIKNGSEFTVFAKNSAGVESRHLKVQYNFEKPVLEKLYFSQGISSKQDLTNALYDGSRPLISLLPGRALTYEIRMSNSDFVQDVYVISDKNGETKIMEAKYQGNNEWIAGGKFNHSDNIIPGQISVAYIPKSFDAAPHEVPVVQEDEEDETSVFDQLQEQTLKDLVETICDVNEKTEKAKDFYKAATDMKDGVETASGCENILRENEDFKQKAEEVKQNCQDPTTVDLVVSLYNMCSYADCLGKSTIYLGKVRGEGAFDFILDDASKKLSESFSGSREILEEFLNDIAEGKDVTERVKEYAESSQIKDIPDFLNKMYKKVGEFQGNGEVSGRYAIDPSGYVYEGIPENRLSGVTVSIYYKENENDTEQLWDAAEYEQENMIVTGDGGEFAWEVSEGWYRVEAVKEGYETASSEWMYIPPERTDVYIPMYNYTAPEVENVAVKDGNVEILFDKFMQISTVTDSAITLLQNGQSIVFKVEAVWDEPGVTAENGYTTAKRFLLIPENGELDDEPYDLIVDNSVTSYANVTMKTLFNKRIKPEDAISPVSAVIKMNTNKAVVNQNVPVVSSDYIYANNTAMVSGDSLGKLFGTDIEESSSCYKIIINGITVVAYKNTTEWEVITHDNQTLKVNVNNQVQIMDGKAYFSIRDICTLTELNLYYTEDPSGQYIIITNAAGSDEAYYNELLQSAKPYFDDYGNTFDTAYQWEISSVGIKTVNGILDYAADIDMFKFTVPITGTYTIYSSDITPDLKAWLYDSNQMQIAGNDYSGENENFKITVSLTEGQTYYLKIGGSGENGIGDYTVNLAFSMDYLILKYNSPYSVFNGNKIENTQYSGGYATATVTLNQGVSMIPVRFLCEVANLHVAWNENTQTVTVTNPSTGEYVCMMVDNRIVVKYSRTGEKLNEWELPMAPQMINGITMIPLRAVSECLGYYVEYAEKDYGTYIIISSTPQTQNVDMLCEMAKRLEI